MVDLVKTGLWLCQLRIKIWLILNTNFTAKTRRCSNFIRQVFYLFSLSFSSCWNQHSRKPARLWPTTHNNRVTISSSLLFSQRHQRNQRRLITHQFLYLCVRHTANSPCLFSYLSKLNTNLLQRKVMRTSLQNRLFSQI